MNNNNRTLWERSKRWLRYQYLRVMRTNATPYSIAMGMAVGIFVGFLPIVPLQTAMTIVLCLPLRGNPVVGFMGTWISNPFNWVPFYYFLYIAGRAIVPWDVPVIDHSQFAELVKTLDVRELMNLGNDLLAAFKVMIIAGALMGLPAAGLTYIITRRAVLRYRKRRMLKLLKKKTRL